MIKNSICKVKIIGLLIFLHNIGLNSSSNYYLNLLAPDTKSTATFKNFTDFTIGGTNTSTFATNFQDFLKYIKDQANDLKTIPFTIKAIPNHRFNPRPSINNNFQIDFYSDSTKKSVIATYYITANSGIKFQFTANNNMIWTIPLSENSNTASLTFIKSPIPTKSTINGITNYSIVTQTKSIAIDKSSVDVTEPSSFVCNKIACISANNNGCVNCNINNGLKINDFKISGLPNNFSDDNLLFFALLEQLPTTTTQPTLSSDATPGYYTINLQGQKMNSLYCSYISGPNALSTADLSSSMKKYPSQKIKAYINPPDATYGGGIRIVPNQDTANQQLLTITDYENAWNKNQTFYLFVNNYPFKFTVPSAQSKKDSGASIHISFTNFS